MKLAQLEYDRCSVVMHEDHKGVKIGGLAPALVWNLQGKVNHLWVNLLQTWEAALGYG